MKDMVTNGTGNSRYLKTSLPQGTTWESALAMLREGTFPIDLNGLNNGGITQLGSAYSKANVLPDDVCAALGLDDSTAEPKDAFALLSALAKNVVIEKITTSCTWTAPKAVGQKFRIYGVGGGGAGGRGSYYPAGGGGGGNINIATVTIPQNTVVSVVCGAGGVAPSVGNSPGGDGGDSIFGSYLTATKGRGGGGGVAYAAKGGDGGAGGGGGVGGAGGNGGTYGGGGGGGGWYDDTKSHTTYRGGNGGNGGTYGGGGGGGGYFGQGGEGIPYSGGGGGGLFANGGSAEANTGSSVWYGGGGAGISDATDGDGTSGGFYILYYKED